MGARRHPGRWIAALVVAALVAVAAAWPLALWIRERRTEARLDRCADLIWREAEARALPPDLVRAVIRAESRGCPRAVSAAGAKGLMQVMPLAERDACDRLGLAPGDLFDPEHNVRVGTAYLAGLVERFGGDLHLALAAYHWGPGRVQALRREHPDLSGKDLIARHGPRATVCYLREVLKDRPVVLPVR